MRNPFKKRAKAPEGPQYKYDDYPGGGPYKNESLYDYHVRVWNELDPEIRRRASLFLRAELSEETKNEFVDAAAADPKGWMVEHHHFAGTALRNLLREAIKDGELPTGNWDDYYVAATEAACGLISY